MVVTSKCSSVVTVVTFLFLTLTHLTAAVAADDDHHHSLKMYKNEAKTFDMDDFFELFNIFDFFSDDNYQDKINTIEAYTIITLLYLLTVVSIQGVGILQFLFPGAPGSREFPDEDDEFNLWTTTMSRLSEAIQSYDVTNADCRKLLACRMHSDESEMVPLVKMGLDIVTDGLTFTGIVDWVPLVGNLIREYDSASKIGKDDGDCSRFDSCPYSF